jgi:hypothetical protein
MASPKGTRPPLVVDPIFEIIILGTQGAGGSTVTPALNRFYYRQTGGPAAVLSALTTAFAAGPLAALAAAANVRWAANNLKVRLVNDPLSAALQTPSAVVGAIATDPQPSENDVVVNVYSGARGRSGRGFKHYPGVNEADTTADVLTGAGLGRWQAVRDATKNTLTDANGTIYTPFLLSPSWSNITKAPTAIYGVNVTAAKLNIRVATMKRRKSKTVLS